MKSKHPLEILKNGLRAALRPQLGKWKEPRKTGLTDGDFWKLLTEQLGSGGKGDGITWETKWPLKIWIGYDTEEEPVLQGLQAMESCRRILKIRKLPNPNPYGRG